MSACTAELLLPSALARAPFAARIVAESHCARLCDIHMDGSAINGSAIEDADGGASSTSHCKLHKPEALREGRQTAHGHGSFGNLAVRTKKVKKPVIGQREWNVSTP